MAHTKFKKITWIGWKLDTQNPYIEYGGSNMVDQNVRITWLEWKWVLVGFRSRWLWIFT